MHTGVIYGFFRQILVLSETFQTAKFIFCWDGQKYLRKQIYPEYKASRAKQDLTPEEKQELELAYMQFEQIHTDILPALGFNNNFRLHGYEADDIIAYIVKQYEENWVVVSSDADLYQLLDYCKMYLQKKKMYYTKQHLQNEYGIKPAQWSEVKALAGCATDSVQGIRGIGEKTAANYVSGCLSMTTKKYKDIVDEFNKGDSSLITRNRKLVTLPMQGFPGVELVTDSMVYWSDFEMMCHQFGFSSFLTGTMANQWQDMFRRRAVT
jgi:DNA polymerase-1